MDKTHHLSIPMIDWSFDDKNEYFCPQEKDEEILGPELPYLSAIDTLVYLANCTWTYKFKSIVIWKYRRMIYRRSETKYCSLVTTLLLHEDLSSEQRCRNS
jgi:hypothetical protein